MKIKKIHILALLNIAAAAAIGISAGMLYKYYMKDRAAEKLRDKIEEIVDSVDARIGVGAVLPDGDSLAVYGGLRNGNSTCDSERFPMLSVFKFHQALAVCGWLREGRIPLSAKIKVDKSELHDGTWSPLREDYPSGGDFSWGDLLEYTLTLSDNNACDILFSRTCGPSWTDSYIKSLGEAGFSIECTENMMHEDLSKCLLNWSTPLSAARILEKFYECRKADEYSEFVWKTMAGCRTGEGRIPEYIHGDAVEIAHKTGTGDTGADGRIMAVNDIGTVVLNDGRHFSLAVFISDAGCSLEECEETIARIALAVMDAVR